MKNICFPYHPTLHYLVTSFAVIFFFFHSSAQGPRLVEKDTEPDSRIFSGDNFPTKNDLSTFALTVTTSVIQPTCGYNDGAIIVNATGGIAPYKYTLNGTPYNTPFIGDLGLGTYTLTVLDAAGVSFTAPPITLASTPSAPHLAPGNVVRATSCTSFDGSVEVIATGGVPPYQYTLDAVNYQTSNVFTGLTDGIYKFYVKDANGCIAYFGSGIIDNLLRPIGCNSGALGYSENPCTNTAGIELTQGGIGQAYTYSTDGINYTSNWLYSVGYGVHHFWLKDYLGNVKVFSFSFAIFCRMSLSSVSTNETCGLNNGSITITANNGTAPYLYSIDGINFQNSNIFTGLTGGEYTVMVKDVAGNKAFRTVIVQDNCPNLNFSTTAESCAKNDGTITVVGSDGVPPYDYSKDGVNFQTSDLFTGLAAGNYTMTIRDAIGAKASGTAIVYYRCVSVTGVPTHITCTNPIGRITANATGGTPPYSYSIDGINFQFSNVFNNLAANTYTLTAKDLAGNIATTSVTINSTPVPVLQQTVTPSFCTNNNGAINISAASGTGLAPFQYSINGTSYQGSGNFTGLSPAVYPTYIKDANNCVVSGSIEVKLNCPTITLITVGETCTMQNGSITVSVTNSNGFDPYFYSLNSGPFQPSPVFPGL